MLPTVLIALMFVGQIRVPVPMSATESESRGGSHSDLPSLSAQHLYQDAILSIIQFLDFEDVVAAHASCCAWRNAAFRAPSRKIKLRCSPKSLAAFAGSAFRHHVASYDTSRWMAPMGFEDLATLRAFPALVDVQVKFDPEAMTAADVDTVESRWPLKLHTMDLTVRAEEQSSEKTQRLLECLCKLSSLTSLRLAASERPVSFQPLRALPCLRHLTISGVESSLVDEDYAALKQLSSLQHLSVNGGRWTEGELEQLCSPPQALQHLQKLDIRWTTLTPAFMESLLQLPALTSIQPYAHNEGTLPYLPRIVNLRSLDLWRSDSAEGDWLPCLKQCPGLTELSLWHCAISPDAFTELCTSLPALSKLTLFGITDLGLAESESALRSVTLLSQLETLQLHRCEAVTLAHIRHAELTQLPRLRHLSVSLRPAELREAQALLQPPSLLLPKLVSLWIGTTPSAGAD